MTIASNSLTIQSNKSMASLPSRVPSPIATHYFVVLSWIISEVELPCGVSIFGKRFIARGTFLSDNWIVTMVVVVVVVVVSSMNLLSVRRGI